MRQTANISAGEISLDRIIGHYEGRLPGPLLVIICNMHGNEPSGNQAAVRVMRRLTALQTSLHGRLVIVSGNLSALQRGVRYIDGDLNRQWTADRIQRLHSEFSDTSSIAEEIDMWELYHAIRRFTTTNITQGFVVDLHTTSADSAPFIIMGDTLRNRQFAAGIPVPMVLGIEEEIEGTLSAYLTDLGFVAITFEAGQHVATHSVDRHEAAIWLALVSAGCIAAAQVPDYNHYRSLLEAAVEGLPAVFESRFRFHISTGNRFVMQPGFDNFTTVKKGQKVAEYNDVSVTASATAYIFMPLYQQQGNDGYFLIRPIRPFWLELSAWVRQLRLDQRLHWLPGVYRHVQDGNTFMVNQRVARFLSLPFFHLLGYRKVQQVGSYLYVTRRKHDTKGPVTLAS